jgi:hypothetical protein
MGVVHFKSRDDGDGTYDGQIGHAYLHLDDDPPESEGREPGFITLTEAAEVAREHGVELDVDGPSREDWEKAPQPRRSFLSRLLDRSRL